VGRRAGYGQQMTVARTEGEMLDVEAEIDRQTLALWPGVILALGDRRVGVTVVVGETEHWRPHFKLSGPRASRPTHDHDAGLEARGPIDPSVSPRRSCFRT